jgi:mRNA interferase MazF
MDKALGQIGAGKGTFVSSARRRTPLRDRVLVSQGEMLCAPTGWSPGFRRPVVVVRSDALNQSRMATVVRVPLTSNLKWALAAGNARLSARTTGRPRDSVANVSQLLTLKKELLTKRAGRLPRGKLELLFFGIDLRPEVIPSVPAPGLMLLVQRFC